MVKGSLVLRAHGCLSSCLTMVRCLWSLGGFAPRGPAVPLPPQQPKFGKLVVTCNKGLELKAGQGIFGKANPYCNLRIGSVLGLPFHERRGG